MMEKENKEKIVNKFLSLVTCSYSYPTHGISSLKIDKFVEEKIGNDSIESDDEDDAIDDYPIQIFMAFLLSKGILSLDDFKKLVKDTKYRTGRMNFKEYFKELLNIGIKINPGD